jgi:hypothetical protein
VPRIPIASAAALLAILGLATPAFAQDAGEKINQLIIYGKDPCPVSTDGEITVCARKEEEERYRIPEALRDVESPANDAWNNRVLAYETVGRGGVLSCSPVGGGGWTGCSSQLIDAAYAEKEGDPQIRFSELIAAERAKRLATIDAEADDTQRDVEDAERQHDDRKRREREAAAAAAPQGQ